MAGTEQTAGKRNILWIPHRRKVLPSKYNRWILQSTLQEIPRYDVRQLSSLTGNSPPPCYYFRRKKRNHFSLLFSALHTTGNRGNVWELPEYAVASHTQCLADVTERNGWIATWGINLVLYETIVRAISGKPKAVEEVLRHYSRRIRLAANTGKLLHIEISSFNCFSEKESIRQT